jgi:hypothetical protein
VQEIVVKLAHTSIAIRFKFPPEQVVSSISNRVMLQRVERLANVSLPAWLAFGTLLGRRRVLSRLVAYFARIGPHPAR